MPIYCYECSHCKKVQEIEQKITEDALTLCPLCGKEALKKVVPNSISFQLTGTGFYKTDYENKPPCNCTNCPHK